MAHFKLMFVNAVYGSKFIFLVYGYPIAPAPFFEETIFSALSSLGTTNIRVCFWTLNSISRMDVSILLPVPHCLDYCRFVARLESR